MDSDTYRYGFNGKENDQETGFQDYGMRLYNPKLARFFSVDPLAGRYPWYTPYQFAGNMPIRYIDLDGAEPSPSPLPGTGTLTPKQASNFFKALGSLLKGDLAGFVFYSSGGTDPKAVVPDHKTKYRTPIDMQDVDDATLVTSKTTGPDNSKKEFNKKAEEQRNGSGSRTSDNEFPRETPDPSDDNKTKTDQGSKKETNYSYEGSPQGKDFTIINNDTGEPTVIRKNGVDVGTAEIGKTEEKIL